MFIIDDLVVNRKAVAEFFEKYRRLISIVPAATPAITTAHPPQLEGRILFVCVLNMVFMNL